MMAPKASLRLLLFAISIHQIATQRFPQQPQHGFPQQGFPAQGFPQKSQQKIPGMSSNNIQQSFGGSIPGGGVPQGSQSSSWSSSWSSKSNGNSAPGGMQQQSFGGLASGQNAHKFGGAPQGFKSSGSSWSSKSSFGVPGAGQSFQSSQNVVGSGGVPQGSPFGPPMKSTFQNQNFQNTKTGSHSKTSSSSSFNSGNQGKTNFPANMPPHIQKHLEKQMKNGGSFSYSSLSHSGSNQGKTNFPQNMPPHQMKNGGSFSYSSSSHSGSNQGKTNFPQNMPPHQMKNGGSFSYSSSTHSGGGNHGIPNLPSNMPSQANIPATQFQHRTQTGMGGHAPFPAQRQEIHKQGIFGPPSMPGSNLPPMPGPYPPPMPGPQSYYHTQHTFHHGGYAPPAFGPPAQSSFKTQTYQSKVPGYFGSHVINRGPPPAPAPYGGYAVQGYGHSIPYVYAQTHHIYHPAPAYPPPSMTVSHHYTHHPPPPPFGYGYSATYQGQYGSRAPPPGMPYYQAGHGVNQQQPYPNQSFGPGFGPPPPTSQHFSPDKPLSKGPKINIAGNKYYAPANAPPGTGHTRPHRKNTKIVERLVKSLHKGPRHFHNFQGPHRPKGSSPTHFYDKHRYVKTASQHVCQGQTLRLECPHDEGNRYLHIVAAYFGRGNTHDCPHSKRYMANTHCRADLSQFKTIHQCEAKTKCEIPATVDFFSNDKLGDPCKGTHKYLKIFYECRYEKPKECDTKDVPYKDAYACQGQPLTIECPKEGQVIKVLDANFGRQGSDVCNYKKGDDLACDSPAETFERVCLSCRGKHKCEVPASAELFGDSCPGTSKYLSVRYRCFDPLLEQEEKQAGRSNVKDDNPQRGRGVPNNEEPRRGRGERKPFIRDEEKKEEAKSGTINFNKPTMDTQPGKTGGNVKKGKDDGPQLVGQNPMKDTTQPTRGQSPMGGADVPTRGGPNRGATQPKQETPTRGATQPKQETPTRGATQPKQETPTRGATQPKQETPTRGATQPKQETPTRGATQPKQETPTRGATQPKQETPTRGATQPKQETPARGATQPKQETPTRGATQPKQETPTRGQSPMKDATQPTRDGVKTVKPKPKFAKFNFGGGFKKPTFQKTGGKTQKGNAKGGLKIKQGPKKLAGFNMGGKKPTGKTEPNTANPQRGATQPKEETKPERGATQPKQETTATRGQTTGTGGVKVEKGKSQFKGFTFNRGFNKFKGAPFKPGGKTQTGNAKGGLKIKQGPKQLAGFNMGGKKPTGKTEPNTANPQRGATQPKEETKLQRGATQPKQETAATRGQTTGTGGAKVEKGKPKFASFNFGGFNKFGTQFKPGGKTQKGNAKGSVTAKQGLKKLTGFRMGGQKGGTRGQTVPNQQTVQQRGGATQANGNVNTQQGATNTNKFNIQRTGFRGFRGFNNQFNKNGASVSKTQQRSEMRKILLGNTNSAVNIFGQSITTKGNNNMNMKANQKSGLRGFAGIRLNGGGRKTAFGSSQQKGQTEVPDASQPQRGQNPAQNTNQPQRGLTEANTEVEQRRGGNPQKTVEEGSTDMSAINIPFSALPQYLLKIKDNLKINVKMIPAKGSKRMRLTLAGGGRPKTAFKGQSEIKKTGTLQRGQSEIKNTGTVQRGGIRTETAKGGNQILMNTDIRRLQPNEQLSMVFRLNGATQMTTESEPFRIDGKPYTQFYPLKLNMAANKNQNQPRSSFQLGVNQIGQNFFNYLMQMNMKNVNSQARAFYRIPLRVQTVTGEMQTVNMPFYATVGELDGVKMDDLMNTAKYKSSQFALNFNMMRNNQKDTLQYLPFTLYQQAGGQKRYAFLTATSCAMRKFLGFHALGETIIDPDEVNNGQPAFGVHCEEDGVTSIRHNFIDDKGEMIVKTVDASKPIYTQEIKYKYITSDAQLTALRALSKGCTQDIKRVCTKTSPHWAGNKPLVYWQSMDGKQRNYWGDSNSVKNVCGCGMNTPSACAKANTKCNCDIDDAKRHEDEGELAETDHLPVKKIIDTAAKTGSSELGLGEFECFGDTNNFVLQFYNFLSTTDAEIRANCMRHHAVSNSRANGLYYIQPDLNKQIPPFLSYCQNMDQENANLAKTVIAHDVSNTVSINGVHTHQLDYTFADAVGMSMLIGGSQRCEQTVKIECTGVASVKWEATVGQKKLKCTCTTACNPASSTKHTCTCTNLPSAKSGLAKGMIEVKNPTKEVGLPIHEIKFNAPTGNVKYTVGNLECTGYTGQSTINIPTMKTCLELKNAGFTLDGRYMIDPSENKPGFLVYCDMTNGGRTIVHHNYQNPQMVTDYEDPGSANFKISYSGSSMQLNALTKSSKTCTQNIEYACSQSVLFDESNNDAAYGWWMDIHNNKRMNFGTTEEKGCACRDTKEGCGCPANEKGCAGKKSRLCNCNINDGSIGLKLKDAGTLKNKAELPVTQLHFGDTSSDKGDEFGQFTLGPLVCEGDDKAKNKEDCLAIQSHRDKFTFDGFKALPYMDRIEVGLKKSGKDARLYLGPAESLFAGNNYQIVFKSNFVEVQYCSHGTCDELRPIGRGDLGTFSPTIETTVWVTYNDEGLVVGRIDQPQKIVEASINGRKAVRVQYFGVKGEDVKWRFFSFCTKEISSLPNNVKCDSGHVIDLQYVFYGSANACKSKMAFALLLRKCQGKSACSLTNTDLETLAVTSPNDPCPGQIKVSDIRYRCVKTTTGLATKTVGGDCALNPCKNNGLCYLSGTIFKCDCSITGHSGKTCTINQSWCRMYSNRHVHRFDSQFFDLDLQTSKGPCRHILAKNCGVKGQGPDFEVSYFPEEKKVEVQLGTTEYELKGVKVIKDKITSGLRLPYQNNNVKIKQVGEHLLVLDMFHHGLKVEYEGDSGAVRVEWVKSIAIARGQVIEMCGLCSRTDNPLNAGSTLQNEDNMCKMNELKTPPPCVGITKINANNQCSKMRSAKAFTACAQKMKPDITELMEDCQHDVCSGLKHCNTFAELAHLCTVHGFNVGIWKDDIGCDSSEKDLLKGLFSGARGKSFIQPLQLPQRRGGTKTTQGMSQSIKFGKKKFSGFSGFKLGGFKRPAAFGTAPKFGAAKPVSKPKPASAKVKKNPFAGRTFGRFRMGGFNRKRTRRDVSEACANPSELGLANGFIRDKYITASPGSDPHLARLNGDGAWRADTTEDARDIWLQVDLGDDQVISGVMTQGQVNPEAQDEETSNEFVTKFHLHVKKSGNGTEWDQLINDEGGKQFQANNDADSVVTNYFPPIKARYVKLQPTAWKNGVALRMELMGCRKQCQTQLGYGAHKRSNIATDNWSVLLTGIPIACNGYISKFHYMAARKEPFKACIWRPQLGDGATDKYKYMLVGCSYIPASEPDKAYQVPVKPWIPVRRHDVIGFTYVRNPLYSTEDGASDTKCLWKNNNLIGNFNELEYGDEVRFDSKMNKCAFSIYTDIHDHDNDDTPALSCSDKLVEDLSTKHYSASSNDPDNTYTAPHHARFSDCDDPNHYGWMPVPQDTESWIRVDLGEMSTLTGIVTQGRGGGYNCPGKNSTKSTEEIESRWFTQFAVAYSDDGINEVFIKEKGDKKLFPGNKDADSDVINYFPHAVRARFVHVYPKGNGGGLRFEVLGCDENPCASLPCKNNGLCMRKAMTDPNGYVCKCPAGWSGDLCEIEGEGFCRSVSRDHFLTFDGVLYDFHGTCQYKMVVSKEHDFEVIVDNSECGREVIVRIGKMKFELKQEGLVYANGELCNLPITKEGTKVMLSGNMGVLLVKEFTEEESISKLSVNWDGQHTVGVELTPSFAGEVEGLCGNYDGNGTKVTADGKKIDEIDPNTDVKDFVVDASCQAIQPETLPRCNEECQLAARKKCEEGVYDIPCKVPKEEYVNNCIYDMLRSKEASHDAVLCNHLEEYATVCAITGDSIAWRTPNRCSKQCEGGALYKVKGTACPATCGNVHASEVCTEPVMESCECAEGLVFDTISRECIKPQDCGCQDNGCYYARGKSYMRRGCKEKCECQSGGKIVCTPIKCGEHASCGVSQGTYECHCDQGFTGDGQHCYKIAEEKVTGSCGNKKISIDCLSQKIDIIEAKVGDGKCKKSHETQVADTCCSDEGATLAVDRFCQGKEKCVFSATSQFLGEPCIDGSKYLSVKYHCTDMPMPEAEVKQEQKIACQGEEMDIDCGKDKFIDVKFANYGRQSSSVCIPGGGADSQVKSTECIYPASLKKVQAKCQGKHKCDNIKVNTKSFTKGNGGAVDRCEGTLKYLEVRYQCTQAPQPLDLKVTCADEPCGENGECYRTLGEPGYLCQCRAGWYGPQCEHSLSTCSILGLGHVISFEQRTTRLTGANVNPDGVRHTLVSACKETDVQFSVEVEVEKIGYEYRGAEKVFIKYAGYEIELGQEGLIKLKNRGRVNYPLDLENAAEKKRITVKAAGSYLNRGRVNYPLDLENAAEKKRITVKAAGSYLLVKTDDDLSLTVSWDKHHHVSIEVPTEKYRDMCGICNTIVDEGWAKDQFDGCEDYRRQSCDIFRRETRGIFRHCMAEVDPDDYYNICMEDVCRLDLEFACKTMAAYADACLSRGVLAVANWRSGDRCPMECPGNLVYNPLASGCPNSCGDVTAEEKCTVRHYQGCECEIDSGLVRNGQKCVAKEECGCVEHGLYYPADSDIIEDGCKRVDHCLARTGIGQRSIMTCKKTNTFCGEKESFYGCHCEEGFVGLAATGCQALDPQEANVITLSQGLDKEFDCGDDFIDVHAITLNPPMENCDALNILREQCQDRRECRTLIDPSNLGDTCMTPRTTVTITDFCTQYPTEMKSEGARKMACEGSRMEINCGDKYIHILDDSNYGRLEGNEICGDRGPILSTECRWGMTVEKLRAQSVCGGLKKCKIHVVDFAEGEDPCPDTSKYLEVHYECLDEPKDDK